MEQGANKQPNATLLLVRAFKHPSLLLCLLYLRGFQDFGVVGGTAAFITHRMEWIAGGVGVATYYKLIANGYCLRSNSFASFGMLQQNSFGRLYLQAGDLHMATLQLWQRRHPQRG